MKDILGGFIDELSLGEVQQLENITLFPVLRVRKPDLKYITLNDAVSTGAIEVTEVSEGGSVPDLKVINKSDDFVLIFHGEILIGAKQNRVVNTTIIINPKKEVIIPVSCVERGRWSARRSNFQGFDAYANMDIRKEVTRDSAVNLRNSKRAYSNQGKVWDMVAEKMEKMTVNAPTEALDDIYEAHNFTIELLAKKFKPLKDQSGVCVFINNQLHLIEVFSCPEVFMKNHNKLMKSISLDAIELRKRRGKPQPVSREGALKILQKIKKSEVESFKGVGEGNDVRISGEKFIGSAFEFKGEVLHLTVFSD